MAAARVTWDPTKAAANLRKHGVSFEEAEGVFYDEFALFDDAPTSPTERTASLSLG